MRTGTAISRAFGAQIMTLGDFHVTDALAKARELGAQPGYFAPQQFDSEWNVEENRTWLGPEVLRQLPDGVLPDAVVGGVGTGGTIVGVGRAFRAVNPRCRVVAVEPNESCTLMCGEVGRHLIEALPTVSCRASSPATVAMWTRWFPSTATRQSPRCGAWPRSSACSSAPAPGPI